MRVGNDAWARSVRETRRVGAPAAFIPLSHPLNALRIALSSQVATPGPFSSITRVTRMEDDYYSVDSILAENQKIQCTFKVDVPDMGHLDGGNERDVSRVVSQYGYSDAHTTTTDQSPQ